MGEGTKIEWAHDTFNPWWGCQRVSQECENCYAETFSKRLGRDLWGPKAERRPASESYWRKPLAWNTAAAHSGEQRRVFCASMADVFEDRRDLDAHRFRLWELIEATPALTWLLLTKRPENHEMVPLAWQTGSRRPSNVWLGTTCGIDKPQSIQRVRELTWAKWPARLFVSAEPLLSDLDLSERLIGGGATRGVDWLITGAESGHGARPMDEEWVRSLRDQAAVAGTAFFYKQKVIGQMKIGLPMLDGRRWADVPATAAQEARP